MKTKRIFLLFFVILILISCKQATENIAEGCKQIDEYTIEGSRDFVRGYPAESSDGTINVVVEIPAGTISKWEVNATLKDGSKPTDGKLRWEFKKGKPRIVKFLSYPGNYGIIPSTLGGDGDPLDIIILGPAAPRGSVVKVKIIGVLKMLDGGEVDDKIVSVSEDSPLYGVDNLKELGEIFPGAAEIIETWFTNYKEPGEMEKKGWGDRDEAQKIIDMAVESAKKNLLK